MKSNKPMESVPGERTRHEAGNPETQTAPASEAASETGAEAVTEAGTDTCAARPRSLRERMHERLQRRRRALSRRLEYRRLRRLRKLTVPAYSHCKNCGERLQGMYCHRCGQYALDIEQPFWKYIKQYFENVYQFDSKVWQTLWLLFRRPGFLTTEFNAGKINSYVHPFRLYMFISVIFFTLFFMVASNSAEQQLRRERYRTSRLQEGVLAALRSGAAGADTCVYLYDGTGLAEMLDFNNFDSDTLLRVTPLDSRHGLARVKLPRMLLDSCLHVTVLAGQDSTNFAIARQALIDAAQVSESGSGTAENARADTEADDADEEELAAIGALRAFEPGRTPVYTWHQAQSQSERLEEMSQQTLLNGILTQLSKWTPLYMMFLLPLFALLLAWAYRRCRMNYMQHFVHAIHINSFFLILLSVPAFLMIYSLDPESGLPFPDNVVKGFFALVFLYMLLSSHRVYGLGWWRTLFKTAWVFVLFTLLAGLIAAALLLWLVSSFSDGF